MGILERTFPSTFASNKFLERPRYVGGDFPDGLILTEFINGKAVEETRIQLRGSFAPHKPFEFGQTKNMVKELYPGSQVASVQVLQTEHKDIPVRGVFKSKFLKPPSEADFDRLRQAAVAYQEQVEAMCDRGNIIKMELGEFYRHGHVKDVSFRLNTLAEIEYEFTFLVMSVQFPDQSRFTERDNDDVAGSNQAVIDEVNAMIADFGKFPESVPQTVVDVLNGFINDVAKQVAVVTDFVDGVLKNVEDIQKTINRAIGLIKNCRTFVAKTKRRIGMIENNYNTLSGSQEAARQAADFIWSVSSINQTQDNLNTLSVRMAALQKKFAALASTIPLYRHLVSESDTLQKIAIKYYNNADHWEKIYAHNKLRSTVLEKGTVLEIPRL